ncbi:MAG TPA: low molecular weight protein-tyrosine-phosphatase [Steroidobacteraceae bacterium]|jgi:protein-tyrosine phosphatase|nr:low molecular weight protein-tyrosine-phosphatase [Steroidobacteraceae bacterium]
MPVRVLLVCMGNICRSPTAEAVLRSLAARLAPDLAIEIDSAGTHGYHIGQPPDARAQEVARGRGIDMSGLRARQLVLQDFERFDWILVMDRDNHAATCLLAPPQHHHRVRLLLEFAPQLPLREVPDPYYGGVADFERVFELTEQAGRGLLQALRGQAAANEAV